MSTQPPARPSGLPEGEAVQFNLLLRRIIGLIVHGIFASSLVIGITALLILMFTIIDNTAGLVAIENKIEPQELADQPLEQLAKDELVTILQDNVSRGRFRQLEREIPMAERSQEDLYTLVLAEVVEPTIERSYNLTESLLQRNRIEAEVAERFPDAILQWRSWLNPSFLTEPMSSVPAFAGVRTAIFGSLWMIGLTILIAFPVGVAAAIYLEEYARKNFLTNLIETNINNLAGVPSIIYGMLGLAIFVRNLERYTSGTIFGVADSNGRTILSASLTMALLILPLIIINAREAIRAVPNSLRQASYGLGATRWQTIWYHVLPQALPGILTGTILGISRAIGETAPLIVVGASTFIVSDPTGPFSKFTVLPIQIYNWTQQPSDQFRDLAAAAIVVLLILLLSLNATAILLRNRFGRQI